MNGIDNKTYIDAMNNGLNKIVHYKNLTWNNLTGVHYLSSYYKSQHEKIPKNTK